MIPRPLEEIEKIKGKVSSVEVRLDDIDEALKKNVPVNLNNNQMKNIHNDVWRTLANDTAKLKIVKHRLMGCIFNLESTLYDCSLTAK